MGYVGAVIEVARAIEGSGRKLPPAKAVGATAAPISSARSTDSLRFPSGLVVSGDGILAIFDPWPDAVRLFQIWQAADYSLRLCRVPGRDPDAKALMWRGLERLRRAVRDEVPVQLEVIDAIEHDRGKQRIVVSAAPGALAPRPHGAKR
jgi:hypothetical protein